MILDIQAFQHWCRRPICPKMSHILHTHPCGLRLPTGPTVANQSRSVPIRSVVAWALNQPHFIKAPHRSTLLAQRPAGPQREHTMPSKMPSGCLRHADDASAFPSRVTALPQNRSLRAKLPRECRRRVESPASPRRLRRRRRDDKSPSSTRRPFCPRSAALKRRASSSPSRVASPDPRATED